MLGYTAVEAMKFEGKSGNGKRGNEKEEIDASRTLLLYPFPGSSFP